MSMTEEENTTGSGNSGADNSGADKRGADNSDDSRALVSRLRVIEDQPLESRAAAFAQVHDELQSVLEGGDSHR